MTVSLSATLRGEQHPDAPAFPLDGSLGQVTNYTGMSIRTYAAIHIAAALVIDPMTGRRTSAAQAVSYADALLAELEKPRG